MARAVGRVVARSPLARVASVGPGEAARDTWLRALSRLGCVSVVVPVYNASSSVGRMVEAVSGVLEEAGVSYEVIVVDDGSSDDSFRAALGARVGPRGRLIVLRYVRNRGKGFAVLLGLLYSSCEYACFIDGDGDIDPRQVVYVLAPLVRYDAVVTSKWHPGSRTLASGLRRFLSYGFRGLVWLLTGLRLRDTQTGAKGFRMSLVRCLLPHLRLRRYAFDVELLTGLSAMGARILEVPSTRPLRLQGSRVIKPSRVWGMFVELLAVSYRHVVKRRYRRVVEECLGKEEPWAR